jgi:hypothetical protein
VKIVEKNQDHLVAQQHRLRRLLHLLAELDLQDNLQRHLDQVVAQQHRLRRPEHLLAELDLQDNLLRHLDQVVAQQHRLRRLLHHLRLIQPKSHPFRKAIIKLSVKGISVQQCRANK